MQHRIRQPKNLAHRGASGHAPENTMAAFAIAEKLGADGFEFDVQVTRDGVPVVIHDETLQRTTNGRGYVFEHTFAELQKLDAGAWYGRSFIGEQIPALEEVIRTFGSRMFLNIELKNSYYPMPELEEKTLQLIRKYGIEKRVLLSSFHHGSMQKVHQLAPDIPTGLLFDCCIVDVEAYAKRIGASALHPYFETVRADEVEEAHRNGLQVNVWTVNELEPMQRMITAGVDAIITNYPDRLRTALDLRKKGTFSD